jgi:polyhydroxyalkanoate synthesis regulator protein
MLTLAAVPWPTGATDAIEMVKSEHRVTIKRYGNRRLYNTNTGSYVTVEDIAGMADDEDIVVHDAVTGEDITDLILAKKRLH